jgi:hypothetical protein
MGVIRRYCGETAGYSVRLRSSSFALRASEDRSNCGGQVASNPPYTALPLRHRCEVICPSTGESISILIDAAHEKASRCPKIACAEKLILLAASSRFPFPVLPRKIFLFRFFRNWCLLLTSRAREEGRFAVVTNVGRGMRWTCRSCSALFARRRTTRMRTAKPCGPGIPTLMLSLRRRFRVMQVTVAKKPGAPGRARNRLLKPLRGECRMIPVPPL